MSFISTFNTDSARGWGAGVVSGPPADTITWLSSGRLGVINQGDTNYSVSVSATSALSLPITYTLNTGALPADLTLAANGLISGNVSNTATTGSSNFTILATTTGGNAVSSNLYFTVQAKQLTGVAVAIWSAGGSGQSKTITSPNGGAGGGGGGAVRSVGISLNGATSYKVVVGQGAANAAGGSSKVTDSSGFTTYMSSFGGGAASFQNGGTGGSGGTGWGLYTTTTSSGASAPTAVSGGGVGGSSGTLSALAGAGSGGGAGGASAGANGGSPGGGGAGGSASVTNSGTGANGQVIISYAGNTALATGGTITTSGGYTFHTFTANGTFTTN